MPILNKVRRFTVDDYEKMGSIGIFAPEERLELIEGVVCRLPPITASHAWVVNGVSRAFVLIFSANYTVSIQNPVRLSNMTEVQPDAAVLTYQPKGTTPYIPQAHHAFLIVEVSDGTLAYDRDRKLPLYAAAGIPEVWIIDVTTMVVEQYITPTDDGYSQMNRWHKGEMIPTTLGVSIAAADVLV